MREEEIRKKYQRDNENNPRGTNVKAMDKFVQLLSLQKESTDSRINDIAENFGCIDKLAPNFTIFEAKECFFMRNFKAYQISEDTNMLVAAHEFGYAVLSIMNHTVVPEDYKDIIEKAKQHAISPENREDFRGYIQYLSGKTEEKENRTEAEKGPVSDIISSIFQFQGLRIGSPDNICWLPSSYSREYYYNEEKEEPDYKNIFDEDFANYYTLKANNCIQEIETVKKLFGEEFVQVLDGELEKACETLMAVKESETEEKRTNPLEQIKGAIVFTRQGELEHINLVEKTEQMEKSNEKAEER